MPGPFSISSGDGEVGGLRPEAPCCGHCMTPREPRGQPDLVARAVRLCQTWKGERREISPPRPLTVLRKPLPSQIQDSQCSVLLTKKAAYSLLPRMVIPLLLSHPTCR